MFLAVRRSSLIAMSALALATGSAAQVSITPLTFPGTTLVGATSAPVVVTLTAQSSGSISSLVALTGGMPNLDFAATPVTCTNNLSLTAGQSCTVSVTFTPQYAGARQGAVIAESGSQWLASAPLSGLATGSLPVLVPGTIQTVAGDGDWIYQRDGLPATQAPIFLPSGVAVDAGGNLFLCDSSNNRVRRVDAGTGYISTVAGDGSAGSQGDGGLATAAELSNPSGLAIDGAGNLFVADSGNNVVRRVDASSGVITTFAGQIGVAGYQGDGGPATSALLTSPRGLALMPGGDLIIADSGNNVIRLVNVSSSQIATVAGTGAAGYNQDGVTAITAELNEPYGVAVRSDNAIAIADLANQRVRLVSPAGIITTAAGTGQRNAGTPVEQQLDGPTDVAFDPAGDLFIADAGNNRVRVVFATSGVIQTMAGTGSEQLTGDGGPANQASIYGPYALFFDAAGNLWLSDTFHNRVREISGSLLALSYATIKVGNVSPPVVEMLYNQGNANLVLSAPVLNQAELDSATTTCNQSAMAPTASCAMGIEFAPTQVGSTVTGTIRWPSNAPNVTPVDSLTGQVLSVDVTTVALSSSLNPGLLGRSIVLTATVTSNDHGRTGTVTFVEGGTTWCAAVPINTSGQAACNIAGLALGSHTFTASYSGDPNNAASTAPAFIEVIKQQAALVLTVSPNPSTVTSTVTLTFNAVDQSGTPTGSVVFYDGSAQLATLALDAGGMAQWSTQSLSVRTHALSAQYAGDSANAAGASNTVNEQITQAGTATALAASSYSATVGTSLTFTATVTNSAGPPLTGSVAFYDGSTSLGSIPLSNAGTSALTLGTLPPGSHSITAAYGGDTDDAGSTSPAVTETISQIGTVSSLGTDANPLNAGAVLHLTATVTLASGANADGPLTGAVTFHDGSTVLGSANVNTGGQALLAISTLAVGIHSLTASFGGSTNYAPCSSAPISQAVQQTATQTSLSSTASNTLMGKAAGFNVTVTSGTGVPTGQVSLRDGATVLATATLSAGGTASFSTATLGQGIHSMTATYAGDANYATSTSSVQLQTVALAQPVLTLTGPANAIDAGTAASFVFTLTTPGVAPTGTWSLLDGSAPIANGSVTGVGSLPFSTSALSIGTHTMAATYSGDVDNLSAASLGFTVVVRQANSATALASSVNPLTQGDPIVLTSTVTSDSPNLGGQVRFFDGTAILGTANLRSNGTAALSPSALGLGIHDLTAVYGGDTNHAGSTSQPATEVVVQRTTATLTSTNNPAVSGQAVTFATALSGSGKTAPTGAVILYDDGTPLATIPLTGAGTAAYTTSTLTVGPHTISMSYAGDGGSSAAAALLVETVIEASTGVKLTASSAPATFGQPLNLAASVSSNGGTATGDVIFTDGASTLGTAPLSTAGVAVLTISTLSSGQHTLVAQYAGDGDAMPSASSPLSLVVKRTTALALSSSGNPGWKLTPVTLTVAVTHTGASPPTGAIVFTDGGSPVGNAPLDGSGHASLTLPNLSANGHAMAASYAGDGTNFSSASPIYNQTIQLLPTSTSLTGSAAGSSTPQQMVLIAVVRGQGAGQDSPSPGGTVIFSIGSATLGQATVAASGVATLTITMAQASAQVTVGYGGDTNYAASQSTSTISTPTATPAGEPFQLWVSAPSITLVTHQHTTLVVSVTAAKSFSDTIALGCLGLPGAGTCTFSPSQVTLSDSGKASSSLVVDTGNPLGAGAATSARLADHPGSYLCWLPLGLLAGLLRTRKTRATLRRLGSLLLVAAAIGFTFTLAGCGGLSTNGTVPGTYTIKVIGTGQTSGISQTQTITLVVTQ